MSAFLYLYSKVGRGCVARARSETVFPMLRAVLDREVQGWSLWDSDT